MDNSIPEPFLYLKKGSELQTMECVIEWAVDKLLPKQSITLFHGRGGIGKTWLSLILADAISKGNPFIGLRTLLMPVVFVDFENSLPVLVDRVKKIGIEDVLFWHNSNQEMKPPKLDSKEWECYGKLPQGSLLIFDTLRASQGRDENNSQEMVLILSRLKTLRDAGYTILLLHHTPKGNDRTYKGSTVILDLADHVLSLHKVRKNRLDEVIDDEEETDCLYRFGTKDKTRYEPFHIFMAFDPQRRFVQVAEPDEELLQAIHEVLEERGTLNQGQIFQAAKESLGIKSKGTLTSLLRKGEGRYWTVERSKIGRAVNYSPKDLSNCPPPYIHKLDRSGQSVQTDGTGRGSDSPQTIDTSLLSGCPGVSQTGRTGIISSDSSSPGVVQPDGISENEKGADVTFDGEKNIDDEVIDLTGDDWKVTRW